MGGFQFQRSFGPKWCRVTVGKRGISVSTGAGPLRKSKHSSGRSTTTVRTPVKGLRWQKRSRSTKT